jgi:hypothetical protein
MKRKFALPEDVTKGLKHMTQYHVRSLFATAANLDTSLCLECSPGESFHNTWNLSIEACYIQHTRVIGTSHSKLRNAQTTGHQSRKYITNNEAQLSQF